MTPESQLLITLTRIAVTGKPEPVSLEVDWDAFLRLAREHKLAGLAYDGLKKSGAALDPVPEKILVELRNACMLVLLYVSLVVFIAAAGAVYFGFILLSGALEREEIAEILNRTRKKKGKLNLGDQRT